MKVLTIGTFDIPHAGHASFLRQAAALGDDILVGVLSDDFVERDKGEAPIYDEIERLMLIRSMGYNAYIEVGNERGNHPDRVWVESPCIVAVGSDWMYKDYPARLELDTSMAVTVAYIPYNYAISTTNIKERLRGRS